MKGLHQLMDKLAKCVRVEMGYNFPKHPVGTVLDRAHNGEEDAREDTSPAAMLLPRLPFEPMFKGDWHLEAIFAWEDLRAVAEHEN